MHHHWMHHRQENGRCNKCLRVSFVFVYVSSELWNSAKQTLSCNKSNQFGLSGWTNELIWVSQPRFVICSWSRGFQIKHLLKGVARKFSLNFNPRSFFWSAVAHLNIWLHCTEWLILKECCILYRTKDEYNVYV